MFQKRIVFLMYLIVQVIVMVTLLSNVSAVASEKSPLTGMNFVDIPAGTFEMGSNKGLRVERPIHNVTLAAFQIMTTEVTQQMWQEVMGDNPSEHIGADLPVDNVSWFDIQNFLEHLNSLDPGKDYRLPTEAEWEYACRAGSSTEYCNGDDESDLDKVGWYNKNADDHTHPVAQKLPNTWGLYDMHGNVWEWCFDWYAEDYYEKSGLINPRGPETSDRRIARGGSVHSYKGSRRSANRGCQRPDTFYKFLGFRIVRSIEQEKLFSN